MHGDLISTSDLGPADIAAWRRLAAEAVSPNPFLEPEFVLPSARAFGVQDLALIVVRDGARWLAALPVRPLRSWRRVPGRILAAWVHYNCFLGTPLVAGSDPAAALAELVRVPGRQRACLALDKIEADGKLADVLGVVLGSQARTVVLDEFERATLPRRPTADYLEQTISTRHRRELRRQFRVLAREVGELVVEDRSQDPTAYDLFLEMEHATWKGREGTALVSLPGQAEFFREMCIGFAAAGRLQLLCLASERRTVAMRCDLIAGEVSFAFKVAFDETLGSLSPGIHLEIANMARFHDSSSAWFDSCSARDNATMNRLWSGRRRLRSVVACPRGAAGAATFAKWRASAPALRSWREMRIRSSQEH